MTPGLEAWLATLVDESYVMLRPSPIAGVGVFAIRDIPKGCRRMFGPPDAPDAWVTVPRATIEALPAHVRLLVENYCLYDEAHYFLPRDGFRKLDLACYLNHADDPNLVSVEGGDWFEAGRDIRADEELTIDYGTIVPDA